MSKCGHNPDNTLVVVQAWPTGHVNPFLWDWLRAIVGPRGAIATLNLPVDHATSINYSLELLAKSDAEYGIFCESDIVPTSKTQPFLESEASLVACKYHQDGGEAAWREPWMFHGGLWGVERKVLATLPYPRCDYLRTPDGARWTGCPCEFLARRFKDAGIVVAHAGWCEHPLDNPRRCRIITEDEPANANPVGTGEGTDGRDDSTR